MPGFQEILTLILIILVIFFLPKIAGSRKETELKRKPFIVSGKMRIIIAISVLWPFVTGFIIKPWNNNLTEYFIYGFFPILILWSLIWIIDGFKKK